MAAIDQKINLIGVPQVEQGLDKVIAKTKQATAAVNQVGSQAGAGAAGSASPFEAFNTSLKSTESGIRATTEASHGLREALHILHPVLGELGGSMGELGAFARLAGGGLLGVAAAAGGAFLVAIQKAADEVGNLQRQLTLILGKQAGKEAFDALTKSSDELHTSVSNLVPAFQAVANAQQRVSSFRTISGTGADISVFRGLPGDPQKTVDVINSLNRAMQATTGDADASAKAVNSFFQTITKFNEATGKAVGLTRQEFINLQDTAPEIAKALETAFGPNLFERLKSGPIALDEVLTKLEAHKVNFDAQKPPDTLAAAIGEVKTAWEELLKTLAEEGAFGLVTGFLHNFSELVKTTKHEIELLAEAWNAFKKASENLPTPSAEETTQQITGAESSFKLPGQQVTSQQLTDLRLSVNRVKDDFDDLAVSSGQLKAAYDNQGTSLTLAGVGMTNLAASVQKAADASATFAERFGAVNDALKTPPKGFVTAPAPGQFSAPPGSVSAPGGQLTPESLLKSVGQQAQAKLFDPAEITDQIKALGDTMNQAFEEFKFPSLTESIDQSISEGGTSAVQRVEQAFSDLNFNEVSSSWDEAMNALVQKAQTAWDNVVSIFSQQLPSPSGGFGFSGTPLAGGGLVTGGGTGTSDSIPAWLSNREFVLTAASTKFWGEGLLNWMNKAPRFAGGGAVESQSAVVHLHLGNESFAMNASENVATALRQHAVKSRLVSTGRKPSWY